MTQQVAPLEWARAEAQRLLALRTQSGVASDIYQSGHRYLVAPTEAFLATHAKGTPFEANVLEIWAGRSMSMTPREALEKTAHVLLDWVTFVETGMAATLPYEARSRVDAASDLMEQVQRLLDDKTVHFAAPIVLAGAALEALLRSLVATRPVAKVVGKPGITTYATALASAGALSKQDVKDLTAWAGLRNDAAHGDFEGLSRERAGNMADGVNLFMQKYAPATP